MGKMTFADAMPEARGKVEDEAKTAKMGGKTANNQLNNIKRAADLLRSDLVDYGTLGIIERVARLGACLSCLTLEIRKAIQLSSLTELSELNIDGLISEVVELPSFIESLTKVMGSIEYLNKAIERTN